MTSRLFKYLCLILSACTIGNAQPQDVLQRMRAINPDLPAPLSIDERSVQANGIRTTKSNHLTLYTDIRDRQDVDELVSVFDAAVPQWCRYFEVDEQKVKDWHLRGIVMGDQSRFRNAGLMPRDLPDFPAGFQRGHEMWVYLQPGKYYTRHLLLHEGTHAFMQWFLGGNGAPWYSEGMAELLGLNRWHEQKLRIGYRLKDRSEAEYWGRIKLIKEDCQDEKGMLLDEVFNIPGNAFREVRYYAWSWAACNFFAHHPLSRKSFNSLRNVADLDPAAFNQHFVEAISKHRKTLDLDWKLFIGEIEFGYEVSRGAIGDALSSAPGRYQIAATKSWQRTSLKVRKGDRVAIAGRGRFTVAQEDSTPWPCESNGVSIEYYRGRPLGKLVAGILGDDGEVEGLFEEMEIGLKNRIECNRDGILCLRINESPARLGDNQGELEVALKILSSESND